MSEEWRHPTLADTGATASVRCRCGRVKRPMEMLDVRGLPAAAVGDASWLCTTCLEALHRAERLDRVTLHAAKGAPAEWLRAFQDKLRRGPLLRAGVPAAIWGEILAEALDRAAEKAAAKAKGAGAGVDGGGLPA